MPWRGGRQGRQGHRIGSLNSRDYGRDRRASTVRFMMTNYNDRTGKHARIGDRPPSGLRRTRHRSGDIVALGTR